MTIVVIVAIEVAFAAAFEDVDEDVIIDIRRPFHILILYSPMATDIQCFYYSRIGYIKSKYEDLQHFRKSEAARKQRLARGLKALNYSAAGPATDP